MFKKLFQTIMTAFLVAVLTFPTVQLQAATAGAVTKKPVLLEDGKTYSKYDVNGDGKSDKLKVTHKNKNGEAYAYIYVNGKYVQKISMIRGGWAYLMAPASDNAFLLLKKGQFGSTQVDAYKYSGDKFKRVYEAMGNSSLDYTSPYSNSSSVISVSAVSGEHNQNIFSMNGKGINVRIRYKVSSSKLTLKSRVCPVMGNKKFTALKAFRTSSSYSKPNKSGVRVKKGQTVTVNRARLINKTGHNNMAYYITVNGKTGWILESQFTTPSDPILE